MARRFVAPRGRSTKRVTVWVGLTFGGNKVAVSPASAVLLATANAALLALRPFIIIRTRGVLWVGSDQVAATEEPQGAVGSVVVSDIAAVLGITALPDPIGEADGNWMFYENFVAPLEFADGTGFVSPSGWQHKFDSKAMRKVGIDEDVAYVVANNSGADGMEVIMIGRVLFKLH